MKIELRHVEEKDELFIQAVYRSTREPELKITNWAEEQKRTFIEMQSTAQLAEYKSKFPNAVFNVIIYKTQDVGRFYTCENDSEIRIIDITILPEFRGKGIGSFLLKELIKTSIKAQKKICLQVDPANPALHLYLRLGFIRKKIAGRHYEMEREPPKPT